jgi:predicted Fe-Mo cluster-binding NifX family protein
MIVAVTSQNFRTVTGHAGKTRRFLLFTLASNGQWEESDRLDLPKEMSMHEFAMGPHPIDVANVIITASCGEGFIRKMEQRQIKVVISEESDPLKAVQQIMAT